MRTSAGLETSLFGRSQSQVSQSGSLHGVKDTPLDTLRTQLWLEAFSGALKSIFRQEAVNLVSLITPE